MPISSDPSDTFPAKLPGDDVSIFHLRFLTAREARKVARLVTEAANEQDDDESLSMLDDAIAIGLVRHEGVTLRGEPVPATAKPSEFLSLPELFALANMTHTAPVGEELSRKKRLSASVPVTA